MGLGPPAVVGLERALAHSWAPGPDGIGGADLSASGETGGLERRTGAGSRWGRVPGAVWWRGPQQPASSRPGNGTVGPHPRSNGTVDRHEILASAGGPSDCSNRRPDPRNAASSQVRRRRRPRHAAPPETDRPNGRENLSRVVDNGLLRLRRVVSVSPVAQPLHPPLDFPRSAGRVPPGSLTGRAGRLVVSAARGHRTRRGNLCTQAVDDHVDGRSQASLAHRGFPPVSPRRGAPPRAPGGALRADAEPDTRGTTG